VKTIQVSVEYDTSALEGISATRGYVVIRRDKHPTRGLVEYWELGSSNGWVKKFGINCLFESPALAHKILEGLPPGGDPLHDYEVVPVKLEPELS